MNHIAGTQTHNTRRDWKLIPTLTIIWFLSFLLRFGYGAYKLGEYRFQHFPTLEAPVAQNLLQYGEMKGGGGYMYTSPKVMYSYRSPGIPILLALGYFVWGIDNSLLILLTLLILSSFTPIVVYGIGKALFGQRVGLLSSAIFAIYPYSIALESTFAWDTTFITQFTAIHVLCVYKLLLNKELKSSTTATLSLMCGFSIAIAILFRSVAFVLLPIPILLIFLFNKRIGVIFFLSGYLIGLSPVGLWGIRNYLLHDRFIIGTTFDGFNFYKGNNALSLSVYPFLNLDAIEPKLYIAPASLPEGELNEFYYRQGLKFMQSSLWQSALNIVKKLAYFFSPIIIPFTNAYDGTPRPLFEHILYTVPYSLIISAAIVTIKRHLWNHPTKIYPLVVVTAVSAAPYVLSIAYSRFRYPLDIYLIILAAATLMEQAKKLGLGGHVKSSVELAEGDKQRTSLKYMGER